MDKKKTGLIILVVVLLFVIGLLGGYIISEKLVDTNIEQSGNNNNNNNNEESNMTAYEKFVSEYKKSMIDITLTPTEKGMLDVPNKQIKNINLKSDGTVTINFSDSSNYKTQYPSGQVLTGKYLIVDVKATGNGGLYTYYLIKEDGTVTHINEFGETNIKITEKYKNYKEIISIFDYYHTYSVESQEYLNWRSKDKNEDGLIFTDINGNTY